MSGATWLQPLKDVFGDKSPDDIKPDEFQDLLSKKGIVVHDDIAKSYTALESGEKKKEVINFLWNLSHLDEITDIEKRRDLYAKVARHYDKLYGREDVESPGWIILPGPFPP